MHPERFGSLNVVTLAALGRIKRANGLLINICSPRANGVRIASYATLKNCTRSDSNARPTGS